MCCYLSYYVKLYLQEIIYIIKVSTKSLHIGIVFTFDEMKVDKISMKFDKLNNETY